MGESKCKVIAVANHKGGVGKTTSVASLGSALSRIGRKIMVIDLDAQQNLTYIMTHSEDHDLSIYDTLVKDRPLAIMRVSENLDLVPASLELARAEIDMSTKIAREGILKSAIDGVRENYDYIIIDLSLIHISEPTRP